MLGQRFEAFTKRTAMQEYMCIKWPQLSSYHIMFYYVRVIFDKFQLCFGIFLEWKILDALIENFSLHEKIFAIVEAKAGHFLALSHFKKAYTVSGLE